MKNMDLLLDRLTNLERETESEEMIRRYFVTYSRKKWSYQQKWWNEILAKHKNIAKFIGSF